MGKKLEQRIEVPIAGPGNNVVMGNELEEPGAGKRARSSQPQSDRRL
jgi:hypothetical protein